MKDPDFSINLVKDSIKDNGIVVVTEGSFMDQVTNKFFDNKYRLAFDTFLDENKAFYFSTFHMIYLFNKYNFQFLDSDFSVDKKYPAISNMTLIFKKSKKIKVKTDLQNYKKEIKTNLQFIIENYSKSKEINKKYNLFYIS